MKITEINLDARKFNPARREFEVTAKTRREWLALASAIQFTGGDKLWEHCPNPANHDGHRDTFVIFGDDRAAEKFAVALKVAKREAKRPPPCPFCGARTADPGQRCRSCGQDTSEHPEPIDYVGVMLAHLKAGRLQR